MKRAITKLPDAELDIMLILWQTDGPSRIIDVYNGLKTVRPCSKPAIHSLLDRLSERGYVRIDIVDCNKPYKLLTPLVSEADYRAAQSKRFVDKLCHGKWQTLITALIDTNEIKPEDIDEISAILDSKKDK